MAFEYRKGSKDSNVIESSPYWILLVVPYAERFTLLMSDLTSGLAMVEKESIFKEKAKAKEPLLLDNHCVKWNVSNSKSSHIQNASFTLAPPSVIEQDGSVKLSEYDIAPQDWVMFWAMDNEKDYSDVKKAILEKRAANDANSGLKFIGQVSSFKSQLSISGNGTRMTRYNMECQGFREFDGTVFYNELAQTGGEAINNQISAIAQSFGYSDIFAKENSLKITTQQAMVIFSTVFLEYNFANTFQGNTDVLDPKTAAANASIQLSAAPNRGYCMPDIVAQLLGQIPSGNNLYSKILYRYIGVQQYLNQGVRNPDANPKATLADYWGENVNAYNQATTAATTDHSRPMWYFNNQLNDELSVETLHFDGRSVWTILDTYLNHPCNEMYTTLKLTPSTDARTPSAIMPSFICRQIPYSSTYYASRSSKPMTRFAELPRWVIDDSYITSYNIGLSDSVDVNYVKLEPSFPSGSIAAVRLNYEESVPALMDRTDISRNGLRMFRRQIAAIDGINKDTDGNYIFGSTKEKQRMMADIMLRLKYTANGSLSCKGIQEPICVGDNLVVKDTLFHIESIVHDGGIDPSGRKMFNTSFALSHGLKLDNAVQSEQSKTEAAPLNGFASETKYDIPTQIKSPDYSGD